MLGSRHVQLTRCVPNLTQIAVNDHQHAARGSIRNAEEMVWHFRHGSGFSRSVMNSSTGKRCFERETHTLLTVSTRGTFPGLSSSQLPRCEPGRIGSPACPYGATERFSMHSSIVAHDLSLCSIPWRILEFRKRVGTIFAARRPHVLVSSKLCRRGGKPVAGCSPPQKCRDATAGHARFGRL
ncbi:hypothetical protein OH77DRAFT_1421466 [Trametes cingulata]|nr:hypothetical protein OH77DRAFT_1421466 [Trametes cingulata]